MTFGERLTQLRKENGYTTRKSFAYDTLRLRRVAKSDIFLSLQCHPRGAFFTLQDELSYRVKKTHGQYLNCP